MEKRALVIGLGVSGRAAIRLLQKEGYSVSGVDCKDFRADTSFADVDIYREGEDVGDDKRPFALVVLSPGVPSSHFLVQKAINDGVVVLGEVALALRYLRNRAVAITGTNGKTTVTELIEHVLNKSGKKAVVLGNIGTPMTEYVLQCDEDEILVVELSSYQLETLSSPAFEAAVLLNITPDHLDRYSTMQEYARAKAQVQYCVKPEGKLYLHAEVLQEYSFLFKRDISILEEEAFFLPMQYQEMGEHDRKNARAAFALCQNFGISKEVFLQELQTFKKPAHRIEFVKEVRGVCYYDDSKGTNVDAVIQAVRSMKGSVIIIVGGVDKGSSYLPWKEAFEGKVRKIFAIGEAATKISCELGLFFNVQIVDSLEKAVRESSKEACRGEIVLLSPGCSSFDMFRDYVHRGEKFQEFVSLLERGEE